MLVGGRDQGHRSPWWVMDEKNLGILSRETENVDPLHNILRAGWRVNRHRDGLTQRKIIA